MKKIAGLILGAGALVLSGCSFSDFFVDEVAVHNGLIQKMDNVLTAEENFYNQYWSLVDGVDVKPFVESYTAFKTAVDELDKYFTDTKFASSQKVFVEEYNNYYKSFIQDYVKYAGEFSDKVEKDGYVYEAMQSYFTKLDQFTVDFVEKHNKLIDTINLQADSASSGISY